MRDMLMLMRKGGIKNHPSHQTRIYLRKEVLLMHLEALFCRLKPPCDKPEPHHGADNAIKDKYLGGREGKTDHRRCEKDHTHYLSSAFTYFRPAELSHRRVTS